MAIQLKPVSELLEYHFVIPNFQRGYRWDEEQVNDLLNDLMRFQKDAGADDFYCLQPVVVVADPADNRRFTVVDGQQRLTTLLLILKNLEGKDEKCFTLEMDMRKEQENYIAENHFMDVSDDYSRNIDNFYVKKAYDTITAWKAQNRNAAKYLSSLLTPDPVKGYACVIWNVIPECDALEAFRRLNYGKIPLTPAELVKAILLQTDCYGPNDLEKQRALAQRRSMQWDEMDHRLANPQFAAMVCLRDENINSGMEIILDFVADELNSTLAKPFVRKVDSDKRQDNFVFYVIDAKIREEIAAGKLRQDVIEDIWQKIQETYNLLADWYDNREWYHLIGLWRLMSEKKTCPSNKFIAEVRKKSFGANGIQLTKTGFSDALRRKIGELIKVIYKENGVTPPDKQGLASPKLNYEDANGRRKIISILSALNVWETLNDPDGKARFPFDLFQRYNPTSLEHIHPQNITTDISYDEAKRWLADREADALEATEDVWGKVAKSFGWKEPADAEKTQESLNAAIAAAKERVEASINALKGLTTSESKFKDNADEATEHMNVLDTLFGDMAGINPDELHSIANMALVSVKLNSALSNNYLDVKRQKLDEYNTRPKSTGKDDYGTFVPPSTLKAFAKGYRPGKPGNMKFWQPEDRNAYLAAIQEVYDHFTR